MKKDITKKQIESNEAQDIKLDSLTDDQVKKEIQEESSDRMIPVPEEESPLTKKELDLWRKEFKHIYKTQIGDNIFVWKKLKRREYADIISQAYDGLTARNIQIIQEEEITKVAVLYPKNIVALIEEEAGTATTLSEEIMAKSGFDRVYSSEL